MELRGLVVAGAVALAAVCGVRDAPPGAPHHYIFTLFATDLEPSALQPGLTRDELIKALDGRAKGATGLIGTFAKP